MGKELELAIRIGGRLDGSLASAVHSAQAQLNKISKTANRFMNLATMAVGAGMVKLVKDSVETYQGYQSALNSAAAIGGVERGTEAYEAMNKAAREAGRTTVKTAEESANALEYMMLAGWSVNDSTQALMPVLKLSASTGADLATTSDLVTDSMANLGLTIDELPHYLDVAAAANNKTNQTATQLQEAYLGVGGVLHNLNAPIEESAAVLGVLANRGTKGSEAGTALSAILVNMQKRTGDASKAMAELGVSMYDANGDARSIIDVFQDISDKTSGMTEQQRNLMYQMIGGKSHVDSFAKIMQGFNTQTADGTMEVYSLIDAFKNADGALDKLYDIKMDTLEGSAMRLSSAFDDMKISIGERLAPTLQAAYNNLADKMPQIGEVIISGLEKIIPAASKVLNFLVDNADKVVSAIMRIAAAWAAIKIGSGLIKGVDTVMTLGSALTKISSKVGAAKVLQGLIGTFTGIGTAAGTAGGAVTGFIGTIAATVGPVLAVAAALAVLGFAAKKAYDYYYDKKYNYAEGMNESAAAIGEATKSLIEYNDMAERVSKLREIIHNPDSSPAQIENAKQQLEEIAEMLSEEYDLVINADTSSLENAINMAQQLSRTDLIKSGSEFVKTAQSGAANYKRDSVEMPNYLRNQKELQDTAVAFENIVAQSDLLTTSFRNGQIGSTQYMNSLSSLYDQAKELGYTTDMIDGALDDSMEAEYFVKNIPGHLKSVNKELENANKRVNEASANMKEYEEATKTAGDYLTQALAIDVNTGNKFNTDSDVAMLQDLGRAMTEAGMNTNDLANQFAVARSGYTDFATAISDGKAGEMAQNFIDFQTAIGQSADVAVSGAALIANGFQDAASAASAGGDAINNVITSMYSLGSMQGVFDGITSADGVADKLTDMAHAMDLIPENKSITIDANGNFQVIQDAENQIASLKSIGNVDVAVNASGDLQVVDEVTGKVQELQGIGAVDLQVNAAGNIDVLNEVGVAIAQIDSQTGKIITINPTITAGNVNTAPFQAGVNSAANAATQNGGNQNVTMNATLNAGNINTAPFQAGVQSHAQSILDGFGGINANANANITINAQDNASGAIQAAASAANSLPQNASISVTANDGATGVIQAAAGAVNSIPQSVNTSLNASGNAQSQANATSNAVKAIPQNHNTTISASGNALATARGVQTALRNLPSTKNITINIRTNGSVPKIAARGEHNSPGGLYMVNDQNISDPREVIEYGGRRFWYEGRNVLTMLPRGANVLTATQSRPYITRPYINGSHRNGLDSVPFDGYVAELHKNERVLTADEAQEYRSGSFADGMRKMNIVLSDDNRGGASRGDNGSGGYNITYAPSFTVTGNADRSTIVEANRISQREFDKLLREHERDRKRRSFE